MLQRLLLQGEREPMAKQPGSVTVPEADSAASNRDRQDPRPLMERQELEDFLMYYDDLVGRTCLIPVAKKVADQHRPAMELNPG